MAGNTIASKPGLKRTAAPVDESIESKKAKSEALHQQQLDEENEFDIQFQKWESDFNTWREQNANHPDKKAYREYELKFLACRNKLLERREQMRAKRQQAEKMMLQAQAAEMAELANNQSLLAESGQINNKNELQQVGNQPNVDPSRTIPTGYVPYITSYHQDGQDPTNQGNNSSQISFLSNNSNSAGFLSSGDKKGIPGLDLVPEEESTSNALNSLNKSKTNEVIEINDDPEPVNTEQSELQQKKDDYNDAISSGINAILADQKLLSMLSIVTKCQNKSEIGQLIASNKTLYDELSKNIQETNQETNAKQGDLNINTYQQSNNASSNQQSIDSNTLQDEYSNQSQNDWRSDRSDNYADPYASTEQQYESQQIQQPVSEGSRNDCIQDAPLNPYGRPSSDNSDPSSLFGGQSNYIPKQKFIRDMFNINTKAQSVGEDKKSIDKDNSSSFLNKFNNRLFGKQNLNNDRSQYGDLNERQPFGSLNPNDRLGNTGLGSIRPLLGDRSQFGSGRSQVNLMNVDNERLPFDSIKLDKERSDFNTTNLDDDRTQLGSINSQNERMQYGYMNPNNERFSGSNPGRSIFDSTNLPNKPSEFALQKDLNERSEIGLVNQKPLPSLMDQQVFKPDDMISVTDIPNLMDLTPRQIYEIISGNMPNPKRFLNWNPNPDPESDFVVPLNVVDHRHKPSEIGEL